MATPSPPSDRDAPRSVAHEEGRRRVQPSRHRGDERHSSPGHAHPCDRERQADLRAGRGCYCDGGDVSGIPRRSRRLRSFTRSNSAMATGRQGSARPPGCSAANWSFPNGYAVSDTASLSNSTSPPPPGGRELLVQEYVFWDSALMAQQIGIA